MVWIAKLNADILQLRQSNIEEFLTSASILEAERNKIQGQLDQGEKVEAEEQEVTIAFSPWSLFLPL